MPLRRIVCVGCLTAGLLLFCAFPARAADPWQERMTNAENALKSGDYAKAERLCLEVVQGKGETVDGTLGWAHLELGKTYGELGRFRDALQHLDRSLHIYSKVITDKPRFHAMVLNAQGWVLTDAGRYAEAEPKFEQALKLLTNGDSEHAAVRYNQAVLARKRGQHDEAKKSLTALLDDYKSRKEVAMELKVRNVLGNVHAEAGEPEKALEQYNLVLSRPNLSPVAEGIARNNLAWFYQRNHRPADAKREYTRAEQLLSGAVGEGHLRVAQVQSNLGWLHYLDGEYDAAERFFTTSLKTRTSKLQIAAPDHPELVLSRYNLALLQAARGRFPEAAALMDEARRSTRRYLSRELPVLGHQAQLDFLKQQRDDWHAVLSIGAADTRTVEVAASWIVNHKGITLELFSPRNGVATASNVDPWIELDRVRARIPEKTVLIEIARFGTWPLRPRGVPNPENNPRYVAWLIPPAGSGKVTLVPLGDGNQIDQAVAKVRDEIDDTPKKLAQLKERGMEKRAGLVLGELSRLILDPIRQHVRKGDHLIISPDAHLWQVPWAALPLTGVEAPRTENGIAYAVEHHLITYVASGRDLVRGAARGQAGPSVVLGALEYGEPRGETIDIPTDGKPMKFLPFRALPTSRDEANAVRGFLKDYLGSEPIFDSGDTVTPQRFTAIKSPRVLFVSTHGYSLKPPPGEVTVRPLAQTGLALSNANLSPGNFVTGEMIRTMNLAGTELVMLSACETARGLILSDSQGTRSLQQAFHLAGAQTVIATQWSVADHETTEVMKLFFQGIAGKQDKAAALREAQLAFIKERRQDVGVAHPFFWAAFNLSGDWR